MFPSIAVGDGVAVMDDGALEKEAQAYNEELQNRLTGIRLTEQTGESR